MSVLIAEEIARSLVSFDRKEIAHLGAVKIVKNRRNRRELDDFGALRNPPNGLILTVMKLELVTSPTPTEACP